jgi:acetate kinase
MKILVINAGSSSLKFQVIDMENKSVIAKGNVEKINEKGSFLKYKAKGEEHVYNKDITNHSEGMELLLEKLTGQYFVFVSTFKIII